MLESPFIKVAGLRSTTLLKRDSNTGVFLWSLQNFYKHLFCRTSARTAASEGRESDESENDDESYNEGREASFADVLQNRDS